MNGPPVAVAKIPWMDRGCGAANTQVRERMKPTALVLFNVVRACAWLGSGPIPAHAFFVCNRKETIFPTYPFGNVGNNANFLELTEIVLRNVYRITVVVSSSSVVRLGFILLS